MKIITQFNMKCISGIVFLILMNFSFKNALNAQTGSCNDPIPVTLSEQWTTIDALSPEGIYHFVYETQEAGILEQCARNGENSGVVLFNCDPDNPIPWNDTGIECAPPSPPFCPEAQNLKTYQLPANIKIIIKMVGTEDPYTCVGPIDLRFIPTEGDCIDPAQIDSSTNCPFVYDPVCGCDGVTYQNACFAEFYGGVTEWTDGECPNCIDEDQIDNSVQCIHLYDPVCGCDGETYSNECNAYFYGGVTEWTDGPCPWDCIDEDQIQVGVECIQVYEPVCGCDGVTYPNECTAFFYGGVVEWTDGVCPDQCINDLQIDLTKNCPFDYDPVCGCDGETYSNECHAYYFGGVTDWTDGPCPDECINEDQILPGVDCIQTYDPVCGCDGVTYLNECEAYFHSGITQWTDGVCPDQCINDLQIDPTTNCPFDYDPVCGCDGETYSNECHAYYFGGVTDWTEGPCQTDCVNEDQINNTIHCIQVYDPVCGCDGVTYPNTCHAFFFGGITTWTPGICWTTTGVSEYHYSATLFPNPTSNRLMVQLDDQQKIASKIRVFDLLGQMHFEKYIVNGVDLYELNVQGLHPSVYMVEVWSADKLLWRKKFIKN